MVLGVDIDVLGWEASVGVDVRITEELWSGAGAVMEMGEAAGSEVAAEVLVLSVTASEPTIDSPAHESHVRPTKSIIPSVPAASSFHLADTIHPNRPGECKPRIHAVKQSREDDRVRVIAPGVELIHSTSILHLVAVRFYPNKRVTCQLDISSPSAPSIVAVNSDHSLGSQSELDSSEAVLPARSIVPSPRTAAPSRMLLEDASPPCGSNLG